MKSYYYSAALLLGGVVYSSFFANGNPSGGRTSEAQGQREAASGSQGTANAETQPGTTEEGPVGLVKLFFRCETSEPGKTRVECHGLRDDIPNPQVIIATVPDPIATHLQLEFDRAVDGIEEAATDNGYFFRRYWLPWSTEAAPQFSDRASQEQEKAQRAWNRQFPGILIFEKPDPEPAKSESFLVFLVGESPTDGVDRQQFRNAVELKDGIETEHRQPLRILGTTFSGSLPSLDRALKEAAKADSKTELGQVVSGTVTDATSIEAFNHDRVRLRTVVHDSHNAIGGLKRYLSEKWGHSGSERIAIVAESETAFGSDFSNKSSITWIRFPREIAHLRSAYQRYPELSGFSQPVQSQRKGLPLDLDDKEGPGDGVPQFAAQTPVSQESIVLQIANRIRHERIQFTGILATDILDALFISRFLRTAAPDTRLFLLEPDLLFVHASDTLPFEGMLAVTTVPLLDGHPPFEPQGPREKRPLIFPAPLQMGFYNALQELLADENRGFEVVRPTDRNPPLWITAVGREGYIPIAVQRMESVSDAALIQSQPQVNAMLRKLDGPTLIWWTLFLLLTLAIAFLATAFLLAVNDDSTWLADFRIPTNPGSARERARYLTCVLVLATGLYLSVASTPLITFQTEGWSEWAYFASLAAVVATEFMFWSWRSTMGPKTRLNWPAAASVVAVAAVLAVLLHCATTNDSLEGLFFSFRSLELAAGAAPIVPYLFLLGGFLTWAFVGLQRSIFHRERRQFLPRAAGDPILGGNLWITAGKVKSDLHRPFHSARKSSLLIAPLAFVAAGATLYFGGVRSLEGRIYDWLFISLASALSATLIVNCWHFLRCWLRFSSVLQQLEMHPIRKAFTALPASHSWSPIWQSSPRKRSYLLSARAIDVLRAWADTGPAWAMPLNQSRIATAVRRVQAVLDKAAQGRRETSTENLLAQRALRGMAEVLIADLKPYWDQGSSATVTYAIERKETEDAAKVTKEDFDDQLPITYAEEFVALRYLAFIRYVMLQLRNLITFPTLGFMALAFSLMSYPFQGERLIGYFVAAVFATLSAVILVVFAQMDTDAILSRITNTKSGQLGFEFFHRIASYGTLPLVTVLASNFNGVGRLLFSWIAPALTTLH